MKEWFETPCPEQSIAALACSLLAVYGCSAPNPTLPQADRWLEGGKRNRVLLLADGLGYGLLQAHLPPESFLRRHCVGTLSSVFPPTTTAAATALESGLFPAQSGWLGWSVYWPELGDNVNLYPNTTSQGEPAAPVHLGRTFLPFQTLTAQIGATGVEATGLEANDPEEVFPQIEDLCRQPGNHFIYAYLSRPDGLLHRHGCSAPEVTEWLLRLDGALAEAMEKWPDTQLILTADHGFLDLEGRCLEDEPELMDTLEGLPSVEPRTLCFRVRPGKEEAFRAALKRAVGESYDLYTRQEVLEQELFGPGPCHPRFSGMLGTHLAVARTALTLFPTRSYLQSMVAGHGGMTPQELTVPLILAEC